jgi:hypothetical protein
VAELLTQFPTDIVQLDGGAWSPATYALFAGRVRLFAALRPDDERKVGRLCARLGSALDGRLRPKHTASALVGYLTLEGRDRGSLERRARTVVDGEFWDGLTGGAVDVPAVWVCVEDFLPRAGVKAADAKATARVLRGRAV